MSNKTAVQSAIDSKVADINRVARIEATNLLMYADRRIKALRQAQGEAEQSEGYARYITAYLTNIDECMYHRDTGAYYGPYANLEEWEKWTVQYKANKPYWDEWKPGKEITPQVREVIAYHKFNFMNVNDPLRCEDQEEA